MIRARQFFAAFVLVPSLLAAQTLPAVAAGRQKGLLDADNDSTAAKITKLIFLLKGMSDDEYGNALADLGPQAADQPVLVSRKSALKSAYKTMAALEYKEAEREAPEEAGRYAEEYKRVAAADAQAVGIDPETMKESGWATDALKWLANASVNYALSGGAVMVGRSTNKKVAKLEGALEQLDNELADAEGPRRAELRAKRAALLEQLAEAAEPESEAEKAAKKKARLRQLAELLESVSNDEYQEALQAAGPKAAKQPGLSKRGKVLKSSYVTLAALEYRDASKGAGEADGGRYSQDYQRVSRDGADDLAINPETLQETGWGTKLFGLAALGGLGYLVYENQRKGKRSGDQPAPPPRQAECPAGTELVNGRCLKEAECPAGTTRNAEGACMANITCPEGTRLTDEGACQADRSCPKDTTLTGDGTCVAAMTCPAGTSLTNGVCLADITCPEGTRRAEGGQCMGDMVCPAGQQKSEGGCEGALVCPERTTLTGGLCLADITCPANTRKDLGRCLADITCPPSSKLTGGACLGDITCPAGTTLAGGRCLAPVECPGGLKSIDGRCVPPEWRPGVWSKGPPLPSPRYAYALTPLLDGRVMATPGWHQGVHANVELFDPSANRWTPTGSLARARYDQTATTLNDGRVLVVGGSYGYSGCAYTVELYTPSAGTWQDAAPLPREAGCYGHAAALLRDGSVLVCGGGDGLGRDFATAWRYYPSANAWKPAGSLAQGPRAGHTATVLADGRVLVAGGWPQWPPQGLASTELFDPATGAWSPAGPMSTGRFAHSATLLRNGRVLVAGGSTGANSLTSAELFDPAARRWSTTGSLAVARQGHGAILLRGNRVLVAGGGGAATTEIFRFGAGGWSAAGPLSTARDSVKAAPLPDGRVLVAGGSHGGGIGLSDVDIYFQGGLRRVPIPRVQPLPRPVPISPKAAALYQSLSILEGQTVGRSLDSGEDAESHHKKGKVYEQLAMATDEEGGEDAAPAPKKPAKAKPAARSAPEEAAADEEEPAPVKRPARKRRAPKEDAIKREMREMDNMGRDMHEEFEKRRPVEKPDAK